MKIRGNTVGTTMKRSDFNQTDPKKSDYIHNNPFADKTPQQMLDEKTEEILNRVNDMLGTVEEELLLINEGGLE